MDTASASLVEVAADDFGLKKKEIVNAFFRAVKNDLETYQLRQEIENPDIFCARRDWYREIPSPASGTDIAWCFAESAALFRWNQRCSHEWLVLHCKNLLIGSFHVKSTSGKIHHLGFLCLWDLAALGALTKNPKSQLPLFTVAFDEKNRLFQYCTLSLVGHRFSSQWS